MTYFTDEQMDEFGAWAAQPEAPQTEAERDLDEQALNPVPEAYRHLSPSEQAEAVADEQAEAEYAREAVEFLRWP